VYGCSATNLIISPDFAQTEIFPEPVENPTYVSLAPPDDKLLYVSSSYNQKIQIINIDSRQFIASLTLDFHPSFILFNREGNYAYVGSLYYGNLSTKGAICRINVQSRSVDKQIDMDKTFYSVGAVLSNDGSRLYVGNINDNFITEINTDSFTVTRKIALRESGSFGLALSPDGKLLFVTQGSTKTISVISTEDNRVSVIRHVGEAPVAITISEDGEKAYVLDFLKPFVSVIDVRKLRVLNRQIIKSRSFFQPSGPFFGGIRIVPDSKQLLVWSPILPHIAIVDLSTQETKVIPLKEPITSMDIDSSGRTLVLAREKANQITFKFRH
jgi:DNA-binding beta-propeller fold protein YncE